VDIFSPAFGRLLSRSDRRGQDGTPSERSVMRGLDPRIQALNKVVMRPIELILRGREQLRLHHE
jgi:hypothetical protein